MVQKSKRRRVFRDGINKNSILHKTSTGKIKTNIVIKRGKAASLGMKRYFSGKKCPKGHLDLRYVSTGMCVKCLLSFKAEWAAKNRKYTREYARKRYWKNPEKHKRNTRIWRKKNREKQRALCKKWHKSHPLEARVHSNLRRSRVRKVGGKHTAKEIRDLAIKQKYLCPYCNFSIKKKYHVDHKMPISKGGNNAIKNIQLLCVDCNQRKHNKDPIIFEKEINLLNAKLKGE